MPTHHKEDKERQGPGLAAYLFAMLFNFLMLGLLSKWLKKYDIDLKKDGFRLYLLVLAGAWVVGFVILVAFFVGWQVYRIVMWMHGTPVE